MTCFDCNNLLSGAEEVEIMNLESILKEGSLCYVADDKHPLNYSNMMTVMLRVKLQELVKYYPMKLSYENLLYYLEFIKLQIVFQKKIIQ